MILLIVLIALIAGVAMWAGAPWPVAIVAGIAFPLVASTLYLRVTHQDAPTRKLPPGDPRTRRFITMLIERYRAQNYEHGAAALEDVLRYYDAGHVDRASDRFASLSSTVAHSPNATMLISIWQGTWRDAARQSGSTVQRAQPPRPGPDESAVTSKSGNGHARREPLSQGPWAEPSFPAPELLSWLEYDASVLMREHPPVLRNGNKQVVFAIACPDHTAGGHVSYSRWAEMPLPATVDPARAATLLVVRDGFFDYEPVAEAQPAVEWHLNFADPNLFCAYGSALFGQDEMQVAEHPVLGTIREAFVAAGRTPLTVERGRPTPALVMGAERRVRIMTDRPAEAGGPSWLDGIAFAEASADVVRRATTPIDPPTITNIIAMAAPFGGHGRYRREQIELILATAFTGFRVAVLKSRHVAGADTRAIVHSGFWGCGAFGGNRVLMTMLQALAAEMAGLYRLVLHIGEPSGRESVVQATAILRDTLAAGGSINTAELVSRIEAMGLEWGHSDGN